MEIIKNNDEHSLKARQQEAARIKGDIQDLIMLKLIKSAYPDIEEAKLFIAKRIEDAGYVVIRVTLNTIGFSFNEKFSGSVTVLHKESSMTVLLD